MTAQRDDQLLYAAADMRTALQQQFTLDQLDIRSGDTIMIPPKGTTNWVVVGQVIGLISSLGFLVYGIAR